jgi:hypothetical protein
VNFNGTPASPGSPRRLAAITALAVALTLGAAACGPGRSAPPPASFTPSPCPPGWHREHDGDCLIAGTLAPGQPLPLPAPGGTPLPVPPPLARATSTAGPAQ